MSSLYSDALEKEYPQECREIRADEREKTINEIKRKIEEVVHCSFDNIKPTSILRKTLEKTLDEAYEDFGRLKAGDSYIIIHGKRVSTDTAYAMQGIELFIDFVTGRAEYKTYDEYE